ncbi:coiled-coil domain-containing protein 172-like [Saccoglossus kowalevskii]|uniref:Coiled-coil domain-containing protein 172 n=1 Tax=Saccoglossus kowalevskii TaxID=10224 RepID=A0ABM0MYC2_SACKO|nr:PREDICTED: putative uncharacterized protein DDB_G0271606-like [Saccoglossus kowalevskii]
MSLDELFMQILQSEQKAQDRWNLLAELRTETNQTKEEIKNTEDEIIVLQGQLSVKFQLLAEEELNLKLNSNKETILKEQLQELQQQHMKSLADLENLEKKYSKEKDSFVFEVQHFNKKYDLIGKGKQSRENDSQEKLEHLRKEEKELEKELAIFKKHEEVYRQLQNEKERLQKKLAKSHIDGRLRDLDISISKQQNILKGLEQEKLQVARHPQTDQGFKKLQAELDHCKTQSMEGMCEMLKLELQQLQQKNWQQQLQQNSKIRNEHSYQNHRLLKRSQGKVRGRSTDTF